MLDDCSQSLHPLVPLGEQSPQLVDGLVLLLCLLFALVLFGRDRPIRNSCAPTTTGPGHARLLKAGSRFWAASGPRSCPETRGSSGPCVVGIGNWRWEKWCNWCISINQVRCLQRENSTSAKTLITD